MSLSFVSVDNDCAADCDDCVMRSLACGEVAESESSIAAYDGFGRARPSSIQIAASLNWGAARQLSS